MNKLPRGFYVLILAQFLSAVADNALLLVTMALLQMQGYPAFWIPILKLVFTASYVVFGPWVGYCADRWSKPLVMVFSVQTCTNAAAEQPVEQRPAARGR